MKTTGDIRLIATDLDGTLIGGINEFPLYNDFRDLINRMRQEQGTRWAACTGRSFRSFKDFFAPMRTMGVMPDYVIVHHAYIYSLTHFGYLPHLTWNLRIRLLIWANQLQVRESVEDWYQMIAHVALGVRTIRKKKDRLWLSFETEESATVAAQMLREKIKPYRQLQVFKYLKEVDVRAVPFTKGLAVSELARHLGIPTVEILTMGNGLNDISMLDKEIAGHTGCPANSEPEVMAAVHRAGGHIAAGRALAGVLEIIQACAAGTVRSTLPTDWQNPEQSENPMPRNHKPNRHPKKSPVLMILIGLLGIYAVLAVAASYHLLPASGLILLPLRLVTEKLLSWLP